MSTCVVPNPFSRGQNSVKAPLIALAVHFGSTRLIDNIRLTPESVQA